MTCFLVVSVSWGCHDKLLHTTEICPLAASQKSRCPGPTAYRGVWGPPSSSWSPQATHRGPRPLAASVLCEHQALCKLQPQSLWALHYSPSRAPVVVLRSSSIKSKKERERERERCLARFNLAASDPSTAACAVGHQLPSSAFCSLRGLTNTLQRGGEKALQGVLFNLDVSCVSPGCERRREMPPCIVVSGSALPFSVHPQPLEDILTGQQLLERSCPLKV